MEQLKRLKELRKQAGYSQKQLAQKLQLSQQVIAFYETGKRVPNLDNALKIADFFHVSIEYLMDKPLNVELSSHSIRFYNHGNDIPTSIIEKLYQNISSN